VALAGNFLLAPSCLRTLKFNSRKFLAIVGTVFVLSLIIADFERTTSSIKYLIKAGATSPKGGPLSAFLNSHGVYTDKTIFVSIADSQYLSQMRLFKSRLDIFGLGGNYVVLCLDGPCLADLRRESILVYDGFLMSKSDSEGDWHAHVAKLKVKAFRPQNLNLTLLVGVQLGFTRRRIQFRFDGWRRISHWVPSPAL